MITSLIQLLIWLVFVGVILWAVMAIVRLIPMPAELKQAANIIVSVIAVLIVLVLLLHMLGALGQFPPHQLGKLP